MNKLTQKRLKELLTYNQETGIFTWAVNRRKVYKGGVAGLIKGTGYIAIRIDSKEHLAHRLAFLYITGKFPKNNVDHINGIRNDNRWCNLREATYTENNRNATKRVDNKSGFTGVHWNKNENKWAARIKVNGKLISLGYHKNKEDAIEARKKANIKYGFHPNHGKNN